MKKINKYLRSMSAMTAIGVLSLLALLSPLMTTTANAQTQTVITEDKFRRDGDDPDRFILKNTLRGASDSDVIHLTIKRVAELQNKVEIVLVSSLNVRWWKGLTIFKGIRNSDAGGQMRFVRFKHIDTQDDDKSESTGVIQVRDLGDSAGLTFEKAKAFGVHTEMYVFPLSDANGFKYGGMRLTFTWERDG